MLANTELKGNCHTCGEYGHKQTKCTEKNKIEEARGNKKFSSTCHHCSKMGCKAANSWKHEAYKDKRTNNWKKKSDIDVGGSNDEVLLGYTDINSVESEADEVLFKIDTWELALKKLEEILV